MRAAPSLIRWLRDGPGGPGAGRPTLEWRTVVLQESAEEHGLGGLAGLALNPLGLDHHESVRPRVGGEVARALDRTGRATSRPPSKRTRAGRWLFRPERF